MDELLPQLRREGGVGMTVTNNERREVAEDMRKMASQSYPLTNPVLSCFIRAEKSDPASLWNRLADLIEPDRDPTCELELTFAETASAPVRVYECDCCGKSCDSVWAEDYVYCPYCGRLNTAREVEVEP